jgi:prevent-host-death family protein
MLEARSRLSRLVASVESGVEKEIVIARNGRPVAKLMTISAQPATGAHRHCQGLVRRAR